MLVVLMIEKEQIFLQKTEGLNLSLKEKIPPHSVTFGLPHVTDGRQRRTELWSVLYISAVFP